QSRACSSIYSRALRHPLSCPTRRSSDLLADEPAVITIKESGEHTETTWRELRPQVGSVAAWLRDQGVGEGDRVVGYLPNTHHTLDRKSTRLNSSHVSTSYAVFCLKKKC